MYNGILWETTHTGKMSHIPSISTSCATNPYCIKRMENKESVCSHCYANTYMKMRKSLKAHLEENAEKLTKQIIPAEYLPVTNTILYRFESFGDLHNDIQLINYLNICRKNPQTKFALWTKNTWILKNVFINQNISKPDNLSIIVSSIKLNKPTKHDAEYVDHIFTVYDKNYIKDHNVLINCGSRDCFTCNLCYTTNTTFHISEQLK